MGLFLSSFQAAVVLDSSVGRRFNTGGQGSFVNMHHMLDANLCSSHSGHFSLSLRLKQCADLCCSNISDGVQQLCCKALKALRQDVSSETMSNLFLNRQDHVIPDGVGKADLTEHRGQSSRDPVLLTQLLNGLCDYLQKLC